MAKKQFAVKHTFKDGKCGPGAKVSRLICYEIDGSLESVNRALDTGYGVSNEDVINRNIKGFGLSLAHGESYHAGLLIFKLYEGGD